MISHIAAGKTSTLRVSDPAQLTGADLWAWKYFTYRGGVKIYHRCIPFLGELKPGPSRPTFPSRDEDPEESDEDFEERASKFHANHDAEIERLIQKAMDDLAGYCFTYLNLNRTRSVVALAASGPFWRWAVVKYKDVGSYSVTAKLLPPADNHKFLSLFHKRSHFGILGTPESDAELTKMNRRIARVLNDHHTPDCPAGLKDLNLEDSDDDSSENGNGSDIGEEGTRSSVSGQGDNSIDSSEESPKAVNPPLLVFPDDIADDEDEASEYRQSDDESGPSEWDSDDPGSPMNVDVDL